MRPLLLLPAALLPFALAASQSHVSGRTDDRAVPGTLPVDEIRAMLAEEDAHEPFHPEAPLGVIIEWERFVPADNPITKAKVELGRQLYFDKRLSHDGTVSCATCHDPAKGWTDNAAVSTGIRSQMGGRSAPTVVNHVLGLTQFWDGRAASLEEQAVGPIGNPIEMGHDVEVCAQQLGEIEGYRIQFEAVFGGPPTSDSIGKALATFERTILSGASKNDYYERALPFFDWDPEMEDDEELLALGNRALDLEQEHRMSVSAERGRELFFDKAKCSTCHVGSDLTDELFHNIGIGMDVDEPDPGRKVVTGEDKDMGAYKTPTLRNIVLTAPYMHDGSQSTLMEVVEHYDKGGTPNEWLSDKIFPLELTEQEKHDLVRFMEEALSGPITEVEVPRLP